MTNTPTDTPTPSQVAEKRKRVLTPEHRAKLQENAAKARAARSAKAAERRAAAEALKAELA